MICRFLGSCDNFASWVSPWNVETNSENFFMGLEISYYKNFFLNFLIAPGSPTYYFLSSWLILPGWNVFCLTIQKFSCFFRISHNCSAAAGFINFSKTVIFASRWKLWLVIWKCLHTKIAFFDCFCKRSLNMWCSPLLSCYKRCFIESFQPIHVFISLNTFL